jgi:hypothetical protein
MYTYIIYFLIFILPALFFSLAMNYALSKISSPKTGFIFPYCIVIIFALLSQVLNYFLSYEIATFIFILFLPAAGIFALMPFIEPYVKGADIGTVRLVGSILYTPVFFLYVMFGIEPGGPLSILIPLKETVPAFGACLIYFFEICIVAAIFMGGLIFFCKILKREKITIFQVILTLALFTFSSLIFQPLIIGFSSVFVYVMVRGYSKTLTTTSVLLAASLIVASMTAYILSNAWVISISNFYNFSLLTIGLLTPAAIAIIPLIERFSRGKFEWQLPAFVASSVGTAVFAVFSPGSGKMFFIADAISTITGGILQESSTSFYSGFTYCTFLIIGMVIITGVLYGAWILYVQHRPIQKGSE